MLQECDYLIGLCCGGDFAERGEANSEDRASLAAMFLDRDRTDTLRGHPGLHAQCHSEGQDSQQGGQFLRIRDVRVLQIEALGLEIGEQRLDCPSLPIGGERMLRFGRTSEGEEFAGVQTHDDKSDRRRAIVSMLTKFTPAFQVHFLTLAEALCDLSDRPRGEAVANDMLVLAKPKNKGDFLLAEIGHPRAADELPVAHQRCDLHVGNSFAEPVKKVGTRLCVRIPGSWQERPNQRNANAVPDDRNHEDVDRGLAELPVGSVHGEDPRLSTQTQQANDHRGGQGPIQCDMLEETIEPAAHRADLCRRIDMGCKPPQADRALAHYQERKPGQRFVSCLTQRDVLG